MARDNRTDTVILQGGMKIFGKDSCRLKLKGGMGAESQGGIEWRIEDQKVGPKRRLWGGWVA